MFTKQQTSLEKPHLVENAGVLVSTADIVKTDVLPSTAELNQEPHMTEEISTNNRHGISMHDWFCYQ